MSFNDQRIELCGDDRYLFCFPQLNDAASKCAGMIGELHYDQLIEMCVDGR